MKLFDPKKFPELLWNSCRPAIIQSLHIAGAAMALDVQRRISTFGPPRSSPGEPPHVDTGNLLKHIWWDVDEKNLVVYVIADTKYAYYLEYGTSKMAPRPFMRNKAPEYAAAYASKWIVTAFAAPRSPVDESRHFPSLSTHYAST